MLAFITLKNYNTSLASRHCVMQVAGVGGIMRDLFITAEYVIVEGNNLSFYYGDEETPVKKLSVIGQNVMDNFIFLCRAFGRGNTIQWGGDYTSPTSVTQKIIFDAVVNCIEKIGKMEKVRLVWSD